MALCGRRPTRPNHGPSRSRRVRRRARPGGVARARTRCLRAAQARTGGLVAPSGGPSGTPRAARARGGAPPHRRRRRRPKACPSSPDLVACAVRQGGRPHARPPRHSTHRPSPVPVSTPHGAHCSPRALRPKQRAPRARGSADGAASARRHAPRAASHAGALTRPPCASPRPARPFHSTDAPQRTRPALHSAHGRATRPPRRRFAPAPAAPSGDG